MKPWLRNMVGEGEGLGLDYGWLQRGGGRNDKNIDYVICQRLLTDSSP